MFQTVEAYEVLLEKINIYMQKQILPFFNPSKIYWWFSLSGGKDSFVMAHGLKEWYTRNNYAFSGEGFCVRQWSKDTLYSVLQSQITWMPVIIIDGLDATNDTIKYVYGSQAPCHKCSLVRKSLGDAYILDHFKKGYVNILARGLHLSDMAISYLWRVFWHIDINAFASNVEKGKPLVKLNFHPNLYLAKPLCYVRELETQLYASHVNYCSICCGCPACIYPSRRDIVEESLRLLFTSEKWEFDVPGIRAYLNQIGASSEIEKISLPGTERKRPHLPNGFFEYAVDTFIAKKASVNFPCSSVYLDEIGTRYITHYDSFHSTTVLSPKLYCEKPLTHVDKVMIATVGPFWGCVGYQDKDIRNYLLEQQNRIFGYNINQLWSQVIPFLREYYSNHSSALSSCCYLNSNSVLTFNSGNGEK